MGFFAEKMNEGVVTRSAGSVERRNKRCIKRRFLCRIIFMSIMLFRSIIIYLFVLVVIRLMGKRQVGEMQPFEFVITLIMADLACIPMAELAVPLVHGIIPIFTLLIVHFFICFLSRKSMRMRYLLSGRPAIVISPKGINYNELKKLNMTLDDLIESIRGCEVFNIEDVAYAIMETNGKICVIKKATIEPPTREDMKVEITPSSLPVNIVMDGRLMSENVTLTGIDQKFIDECLKRAKVHKIKEILLFTLDNNGNVFIQAKNAGEYVTFQMPFGGGDRW